MARFLLLGLWVSILSCLGASDPNHDFSELPKAHIKQNRDFWQSQGQEKLMEKLQAQRNTNMAQNVIIFIGDGMSMTTVNAARIHAGQLDGGSGEENKLSFEEFPNFSFSKTYSTSFMVTDSAAGATAILTGSKTASGVVNYDGSVQIAGCYNADENTRLKGIFETAVEAGLSAGVISTKEVMDATPAATYAYSPSRNWECDNDIFRPNFTDECPGFKDIALQLVENFPGRDFQVVLGGGYECLGGTRRDGRILTDEWLTNKTNSGYAASFVQNRDEFLAVDWQNTDYLMGLFGNGTLPYNYEMLAENVPTLSEMTEAAITVLSKNPQGFFLMVESAKIDSGHHSGNVRKSLEDTIGLAEAVETARNMTNEMDTLIIVTADHGHTLSFGGNQAGRGNPILGTSQEIALDDMAYTTLAYANGDGYGFLVDNGTAHRRDPADENITDYSYHQQATFPTDSETHEGTDVPIYSNGPFSFLLNSVHEQNYIAHVALYASCLGNTSHPNCVARCRTATLEEIFEDIVPVKFQG